MGTETAPEAGPVPGTPSTLHLDPRLTAQQAPALLDRLRTLQGQDVEVDASGVVAVSTPCIQILLAAGESWRGDGKALRVVSPSTDFLMALDHLGIGPEALQSRESR
jgi:chemotaxis protein CheX